MGHFNASTLGPLMDREWLYYKNVGGYDVPAFGVLEIAGATNPSTGRVLLSCQRPGTTLRPLYVVNGPHEVAVNKIGRCTLRPCFALYTGSSPSVNQSWGPTVDSFLLTVNRNGFLATGLALDSPTRMQVIPQPIVVVKGKLDGALNQGSSATLSVWGGAGTGSDTSFNVTVYDWMLGSSESHSSGKKLKAEWDSGAWHVHAAECE